jgi:hypothetical protein
MALTASRTVDNFACDTGLHLYANSHIKMLFL